MNRLIVAAGIVLAGCTAQQSAQVQTALQSQPGQLFCAIQTAGGGAIVAGIVTAAASAAAPGAAPLAVIATNTSQAFVNAACAQAAVATGGKGAVPVSPPASPATVPQVAIVPPTS